MYSKVSEGDNKTEELRVRKRASVYGEGAEPALQLVTVSVLWHMPGAWAAPALARLRLIGSSAHCGSVRKDVTKDISISWQA